MECKNSKENFLIWSAEDLYPANIVHIELHDSESEHLNNDEHSRVSVSQI